MTLEGPLAPTMVACPYGSGLSGNAAVDIYFDAIHVIRTAADAGGVYRGCFHVPKDATPEAHQVTAIDAYATGAVNGLFVAAPWTEYHALSRKKSGSPTEDQLNAATVASLESDTVRGGTVPGSITGITVAEGKVTFTSTDGFG